MVLILSNEELESALNMEACLESLYEGLKAFNQDNAARRPRIDIFAPTSRKLEFACFSSMEGIIRGKYYALRLKPDIVSWPLVEGMRRRVTYCVQPGLYGGLIFLFRAENAELLAIMNDGYIQHMRVGATAALGARYLARSDAEIVGVIGSGGMARSFALGFAAVRNIRTIKVHSPNSDHLRAYCKEMSEKLNLDVVAQKSALEAVRGSSIVGCCTNSIEPVLAGRWLEPGMYVANVSSREFHEEVFQRITLVGYLAFAQDPLDISGFSDDKFDVRGNAMAYVAGQREERESIPIGREKDVITPNARWVPCVDWATEKPLGREADGDIALLAELSGSNFRGGLASSGIQGIQFAAVAGRAYEMASGQGLGKPLDIQLFLQNIPT